MESVMSSVRNAVDGDPSRMSQEALLQPVRDMGHSEILRGHFRGTQPFEKGLGFPHRVPELRAWDDIRLKGQVSMINDPCKFKGDKVLQCLVNISIWTKLVKLYHVFNKHIIVE